MPSTSPRRHCRSTPSMRLARPAWSAPARKCTSSPRVSNSGVASAGVAAAGGAGSATLTARRSPGRPSSISPTAGSDVGVGIAPSGHGANRQRASCTSSMRTQRRRLLRAALARAGGSAARSGRRAAARPGRAARPGSAARARAGRRRPGRPPSSRCVYGCCGWRKRRSTGPCSAIWPAYMIATRSQVSASTDRSCVMRIIASPSSRRSSSSSSRICACIITSSAVVGSSPMISSGRQARPRAIITRWRMPPENSCGYWRARAGLMPT